MGLLSLIRQGLAKTREAISAEIGGILGAGKVTEEMLESLEEHLIRSDMGTAAAFALSDALREHGLDRPLTRQQMFAVLRDEALRLLPEHPPWKPVGKPHVILVIGVNGAGKTTTIGKLAHRLKAEGKSVLLAAGDTFRAAAVEQLEAWAKRSGADFVHHVEGGDPAAVAYDAYAAAKSRGHDVVIVDTAGRLHNKEHLMEEMRKIVRVLRKHDPDLPHDTWLVLDGTTGQNAINQAKAFHGSIPLTGLAVTKLDGTAKGGSLLAAAATLQVPVLWIGVGERIDQLVPFDRVEFADSLFEGAL